MAEFLLSKLAESVVSQTVQRITDLLIHEAASLRSVKEDVLLLQDELRSLWVFLEDADTRQEHDQRLRDLVLQVKDVAFDAEDVIETFILKVTYSYFKAFHNEKIRIQLSFVRNRTKGIFVRMQNCGIESVAAEGRISTAELQRSLRRSSPNDEDHDVISLEGSSRALTAELAKEEDRLCIVSIVGMGGLGKTTLANKVFSSVKQGFDCSAWVFISQRYVPKDVFIEIFKQVDSSFENTMKFGKNKYQRQRYLYEMQEHDLIGLVKKELSQKRYFVVLDDIWRIEAWDSVKRAFPKGKKGSKILFTTRNREIATSADPLSSQFEPHFLTLEESWELLQRKAFPNDRSCPPEFEELGKEMAQKCGRLPLAVVVLGGLLSRKNSLDEWKKVMRDVNSHLSKQQSRQEYEGVHEILALGYHDLPYYLKPCFLYLGNYPEDYGIPKRKLVRLWIGEGFVTTQTRGMTAQQTLEEVAEGYLEELIDRCMVQVDRRDHTGIGVKTCRMHDLMRDMCILKARNETFAQIIQQHESNMSINVSATSFQHLGSSHSRRLVIHPGCDLHCNTHRACTCFGKHVANASWVEQVHPNLRSLLCLGGTLSLSALKLSNFRMLRVLELRVVDGSKIPGGIGNLIHLRYLCLHADLELIILPSSIANLRNLHTLDLWKCRIAGPLWMISRLIRLRHLLLCLLVPYNMSKGDWNDVRIDELKDIETLKDIPSSVLIRYDALNKLTNLRNLGIDFEGSSNDDVRKVLGSPIVQSGNLQSLNMYVSSGDGFPSLESLSSCHSLSKLNLKGKILEGMHSSNNPTLQFLPASLTKLILWRSNMEQDPMPVLEKLPNLRFLRAGSDAYRGSTMVCSADGFPKLEMLLLFDLMFLKKWTVENGAMPSLKKLTIDEISNLEMIREGLQFVTSLKELTVAGMNNSFCEKLQVKNGIEGEDYYKVRHIPSISITNLM